MKLSWEKVSGNGVIKVVGDTCEFCRCEVGYDGIESILLCRPDNVNQDYCSPML